MFLGKVHACENHNGAKEKPRGNLFVEQPPSKENGGDGIEVYPVSSYYSAKLMNNPTPDKETYHGGYDTEEEQIPQYLTAEENFEGGEAWV